MARTKSSDIIAANIAQIEKLHAEKATLQTTLKAEQQKLEAYRKLITDEILVVWIKDILEEHECKPETFQAEKIVEYLKTKMQEIEKG